MKIASHVLAYNVTSTLAACIENMAPHVDKIFIAHPSRPWGYNATARETSSNPTTLADIQSAAGLHNVEIIAGDWKTDEETRNACLQRAREQGFDWFLVQDADEFYTEQSWENAKLALSRGSADSYKTTWYNFWKSAQYVVMNEYGDIKGTNASFAIRCDSKVNFKRSRSPSADHIPVLDCPCYHYGYARTNAEIHTKISTWAHANDFNAAAWYHSKWLHWRESTQNLHPTQPYSWKRAVRFPLEQPAFALKYFDLPVPEEVPQTPRALLADLYFDTRVGARYAARSCKRFVRNL